MTSWSLLVGAAVVSGLVLSVVVIIITAFVFGFVTLLTFNVFDLLVLDFLVFSTWRPRWIVLPGTEGMAGYGDLSFHVAGFSRGLVFSVVGGLLVASGTILL